MASISVLALLILAALSTEVTSTINIAFDDGNATCHNNTSGRRFHAEAGDAGQGYRLFFVLGPNRTVEVVSSIEIEYLTISLLGDEDGPFTDSERRFFAAVADMVEFGTVHNLDRVESLDRQAMQAARILSEWPPTLPLDYTLDANAERQRQCPPSFANDGDVPPNLDDTTNGTYSIEPRAIGDAYCSLCGDLGSWLRPIGVGFATLLSMDPPCNGSDARMWQYFDGSTPGGSSSLNWSCTEPVGDSLPSWAYGNCFGRCGMGCGSADQFTLDCANYDLCVRYRIGAENGCDDEFVHSIEDTIWSPSCDEPSRRLPEDECTTEDEIGSNRPYSNPVQGPPTGPDVPALDCKTATFSSSLENGNNILIQHLMKFEVCCKNEKAFSGKDHTHTIVKRHKWFLSAVNGPVTKPVVNALQVDWTGAAILETFKGRSTLKNPRGVLSLTRDPDNELGFLYSKGMRTESYEAGELQEEMENYDRFIFWSYRRSVTAKCEMEANGKWNVVFLPEEPKPLQDELKASPGVATQLKSRYTRQRSVHDIYF